MDLKSQPRLNNEKRSDEDWVLETQPEASFLTNVPWWNLTWAYRVQVKYTIPSNLNVTDKTVVVTINFTSLVPVGAFDNNSVRVIEYSASKQIIQECVSQFEPAVGYNKISNATGNVVWVLNGTTANTVRYFYIYFDLEGTGKVAPNYNSGLSIRRNIANPNLDYTIENNRIRISMCMGLPPSPSTTYNDHIYEVYDKTTGRDLQRGDTRWGWVVYSITYGGWTPTIANLLTDMEIVHQGPARVVVRMWGVQTNTGGRAYRYEVEYEINHLDNTVRMTHYIINIGTASLSAGNIYHRAWWNPGRGDTYYQLPDRAWGIGGANLPAVGNTPSVLGPEFSSDQLLNISSVQGPSGTGWSILNLTNVEAQGWFTQWDEVKNEGIGTVFDSTLASYRLIEYGYQRLNTPTDQGDFRLRFQPAGLNPGNNITFSFYGLVFNNNNGTIVKNRAPGIRASLTAEISTLENAGKVLVVKINTIDADPVENARVQLFNSTPALIQIQDSSDIGNVTFYGLQNAMYSLNVYYQIDQRNFSVAENIQQEIDLPLLERFSYLTIIVNLTTVNFKVVDSEFFGQSNEALYNANTSLHFDNGTFITSKVSPTDGWISFILPRMQYLVNITYQGSVKQFRVNNPNAAAANAHNITIVLKSNIILIVTTGVEGTALYINSTSSTLYPIVNQRIDIAPLSIRFYYGDTINVRFAFEHLNKTDTKDVLTLSTVGWTLSRDLVDIQTGGGSVLTNETINGIAMFNFSFDSTAYYAGNYYLSIKFSRLNYAEKTLLLNFEILNWSSSLVYVDALSNNSVFWNENATFVFNYTSIDPAITNISSAVINYKILNTDFQGVMENINDGLYQLTFNSSQLTPDIYDVEFWGNKTNFQFQSITRRLTIKAIPTNMSYSIDPNYAVTTSLIRAAFGENVSLVVNFTNAQGLALDGTGLVTASLTVIELTSQNNWNFDQNRPVYEYGNGTYLITFPTIEINETGLFSLTVQGFKQNYTIQTVSVTVEIKDYWNTELMLVRPPAFYPWANNASFILQYKCIDSPRANRLLTGAQIKNITISVGESDNRIIQLLLNDSNLGTVWNYIDLNGNSAYPNNGRGLYLVWFLTGNLNLTETTVFYLNPWVHYSVYRPATYEPYLWMRTVQTTLTPTLSARTSTSFGTPIYRIERYLDQSDVVYVSLNATDFESLLNGNYLSGATIMYTIKNSRNSSQIITDGYLEPTGQVGEYKFRLNATLLGEFSVEIESTLQNYTRGYVKIEYIVSTKPFITSYKGSVQNLVVKTPQNKETTFGIELKDGVLNSSVSGATVSFVLKDKPYILRESDSEPGIYYVTLTPEDLASIEIGSVVLNIEISKDNFTTAVLQITLQLDLPVDPILGIPIMYWAIAGGMVAIMVTILVINKAVVYARIPEVIKKLMILQKAIKKGKPVARTNLTRTYEDIVNDDLAEELKAIGIINTESPANEQTNAEGRT